MKPKLTQKIAHDGLQHVLHVGGEAFMAYPTRKAAMCALVTAMALTGCQTMEQHPRVTAFVAATLVTSVALSTQGHRDHSPQMSEPLTAPGIGAPDCATASCK